MDTRAFNILLSVHLYGLPWWLRQWRIHLWCQRPAFDSWVGKIPWRRKITGRRQPTPAFLAGKCHGQRSLVGYSPWGRNQSDETEWLSMHVSQNYQCSEQCSVWWESWLWKRECFPFKSRSKTGMRTFISSSHHPTEKPRQCLKTREKKEAISIQSRWWN